MSVGFRVQANGHWAVLGFKISGSVLVAQDLEMKVEGSQFAMEK